MVQIQFQFIDSKNSETKSVTLSHSCSLKILLKTLKESFSQLNETTTAPFISLIDSHQITCHDDIQESYIFWGLYDSVYSQDPGSVFLISKRKILKIRFFLNFDLNSHCNLNILSNSSWNEILTLVSSKFNNFNPFSVKKMEIMNTPSEEEVDQEDSLISCSDTESFWSLYFKYSKPLTTLSFLIYASKCYPIPCQWEPHSFNNNESCHSHEKEIHGIAFISEDLTFIETKIAFLTALRLVSTEKIQKIQVVDCDNDPIGDECHSTEVILRRYNKHSIISNGVKVLITTKSFHPQFSNPTFDPRTAELSERNTDFLGTDISHSSDSFFFLTSPPPPLPPSVSC
jgi:hypothetical protein